MLLESIILVWFLCIYTDWRILWTFLKKYINANVEKNI